MALKRNKPVFVRFAVLITVILVLAVLIKPSLLFVIRNCKTNTVLFSANVKEGYEFVTAIKHSVQKTPVYEYYRVQKDGSLLVTATVLQDLGWGMPSNLSNTVIFSDNYMVMKNINRPLRKLLFRVNYIAKPQIILEGYNVSLDLYARDGDLIEFSAVKLPWIVSRLRSGINVFKEES